MTITTCIVWKFLSTLSLRRATVIMLYDSSVLIFLSTLSLRRATIILIVLSTQPTRFLSTLSLRRATHPIGVFVRVVKNFYPRSPCGERHCQRAGPGRQKRGISIHALLAESDGISRVKCLLPTWISIHALLAESDPTPRCRQHLRGHFYPRSPCGERRKEVTMAEFDKIFLSTLSLRRATQGGYGFSRVGYISIHALLAESDSLR